MNIPKEEILGLEHVFSTYTANKLMLSDALVIKEKIHTKDGKIIPNVRVMVDKKWPFYVTKKAYQNHQDHKEYELLSRLNRYESTRIRLPMAIANAAKIYTQNKPLREIANYPYLYGIDILPTSLIKQSYLERFKDIQQSPYTLAGLDIETDVVDGSEDVIIANITMHGKSYSAVTRKFASRFHDFERRCIECANRLVPKDMEGMNWVIEIVETPAEACYKVIQKAHEWMPDYISIWNMNFDIPKMIKTLISEGYDPAQVFSDPKVPPQFRYYRYKEGPSIKVTHDGRKTSIHPADRWHVMTCPSSFYFLDSMCLRKRIRIAGGNESSYKLNDVLKKEGLETKLKIEAAEEFETDGTAWHYVMQKDFPIEYTVYNFIDDKRLLDYDDKTGDITRTFPILAGMSDYSNYHKNPRRIADDLHFFYLERGMVVGATPANIADNPLDRKLLSLRDWIVTLPNYMIQNGIKLFKDAPHIRTMFYQYLSDLDIAGTYPNCEDILNTSKETTLYEMSQFHGFTEEQTRHFGLNLTGGKSNALELCTRYLGYPTLTDLRQKYREENSLPALDLANAA